MPKRTENQTTNRKAAVSFLLNSPRTLGHKLGFTDLTELHNQWIKEMVNGEEDSTLQGHRGSFKTTCLALALAIIIVLYPSKTVLFLRKTDNDVKEVILQVRKTLESKYMRRLVKIIWGIDLIVTGNSTEIKTNLKVSVKGTPQLTGLGTGGSITGKHFDLIFTDDIVNLQDRASKAERDRIKNVYQELQNIKNRGGRIFNTGTPWHADDAFSIMPPAKKYTVYDTGLISPEQQEKLKRSMTASLYAANYELRHIAEDDVIFTGPQTGADPALAEQGLCHIDAAYGGEDYTAFTICRFVEGKFYVYGRLWHKAVDNCLNEIIAARRAFNAGKIYMENNGDKGYLARDLKVKGERTVSYHEDMNKYLKITTYLKGAWPDVFFVKGTDKEYIDQVCDYNENAEHDDAPDSLATLMRIYWPKANKKANNNYKSIFE